MTSITTTDPVPASSIGIDDDYDFVPMATWAASPENEE
ncbi:MAG: hypothetical protein RL260_3926, partial [Pseudomonadota bacterium]